MVDYGLLPPEVNSGRMYTGPGAGPMLAAAAAWAGLAADLEAAAAGHRMVITELTGGPWQGPASASALAAITPFITWLDSGAEEAGQASSQAFAAAAAYEAAFAATVPPPVIEANRALLAALVATNFLGQNTPAIAATEALYMEFWAQDAGAMYSYAGSSAAATQLTELPEPADVADPGAVVDQMIAAFKAQFNSIANAVGQVISQVDSRIENVLQALSTPLNGPGIDQWLVLNSPLDDIVPLNTKYWSPYVNSIAFTFQMTLDVGDQAAGWAKMGTLANTLFPAVQAVEGASQAAGSAAAGAATKVGSLGSVAGGLGKAVPIGGLSVPVGWTSSAPGATTPGVATLTNATTAVPAAAQGAVNGNPVAPPFGQYINGGGRGRKLPSYGFRLTFMTSSPAAG